MSGTDGVRPDIARAEQAGYARGYYDAMSVREITREEAEGLPEGAVVVAERKSEHLVCEMVDPGAPTPWALSGDDWRAGSDLVFGDVFGEYPERVVLVYLPRGERG